MKDAAQMVPYTPSPKSPPLIRVVMAELLPQAVVRIQKLDPGTATYYTPTVGWFHYFVHSWQVYSLVRHLLVLQHLIRTVVVIQFKLSLFI